VGSVDSVEQRQAAARRVTDPWPAREIDERACPEPIGPGYSQAVFKKLIASPEAHGTELSRTFADAELICREGDSSAEMYVIRRGSVRVFKASPRGEVDLAVLAKGDFFGEMSVLEGLPRDASAQAVGEAEVLVMTAGALLVRLRRDPTFAFELLRRLSGRVRSLNARLLHALQNGNEISRPAFGDALLYQSEPKQGGGAA
jgi:CRP/FNR family transcriptional regulator, cyclic AMP receptor protein